jgi:inorganic triphosphatase YgiF
MDAPREVELKFSLSEDALEAIENAPLLSGARRKAKTVSTISVYFDTDGFKLRRRHVSLRVRHADATRLQTVKAAGTSGAPFERREWEQPIDGDAPDLKAARATGVKPLRRKKVRDALKPIFATAVDRTIIPVRRDGSTIEVTLDRGLVRTGEDSAPIFELELELKKGKHAALFDLARALGTIAPARLSFTTKSERGYVLVAGEEPTAVKAGEVPVRARLRADEAFRIVAFSCIRHLVANEPALLRGDPEGVHQMRVALRRLRAAIAIFGDVVPGEETERLKGELKWITAELAPARDLDVFVSNTVVPLARAKPRGHAVQGLRRELEAQRSGAVTRAQSAVASARYRGLVLDALAWIETGDWAHNDDPLLRLTRKRKLAAFATDELRRRRRKVVRKARKLADLDPRRRHKLRIAVKKLRYATDFLGGAFPGGKAKKRRRRFEAALGALQDCLGALNDVVVHEDLAAKVAEANGRARDGTERAFAVGLASGRQESNVDALTASAVKAGRAFAKAKRFW